MRSSISINGEPIYVVYDEADFTKYIGDVDYETKYLTKFNIRTNRVLVSPTAPEWYKKLAALHEMICAGRRYERLIPALRYTNYNQRSACIERFIIEQLSGEHRQEYIGIRLDMFRTVLKNDLYQPTFKANVENTIKYLEHCST